MDTDGTITGIVLAGGVSSRLGRDKGGLTFGDGLDLVTRTARLLRRLTPDVRIVGRCHDEFPFHLDDVPGAGPVGAVTTALRHAGTACLVLPCDMPFISEAALSHLLAAWRARGRAALVTAFFYPDTAKKENLVAVYEPGALRYFEPRLRQNLLKIALIVPEELYCLVPVPDGMKDAFFNINNAADLAKVREKLAAEHLPAGHHD